MSISRILMVLCSILLSGYIVLGQPQSKLSFTLSPVQSNPSKFHVELLCEGITGEIQDFKMPSIAPGYYRVLDFAANVENFNAADNSGKALPWEKIAKNTWRVCTDGTGVVKIRYDVKSDFGSVAGSFIDDKRAYISTPGVFIYPDGQINHPLHVTLIPSKNFPKISTGLEPRQDNPHSFYAYNFDNLYDCPIYMGNQEVASFTVRGIWHYVAMENPGTFDRRQFTADLKKMIETASEIIGNIPYLHYTFIFMGEGKGGLEHLNSSAMFLTLSGEQNPWLEKDVMKFLTHEYFHVYNVKAIRPVALGPFSYDGENNTDMLWFSEGGTVYYEFIILNRAGFFSRNECLDSFASIIAKNEGNPARLSQSAAEASRKAWTQSFFGSEKEVSYYDKGLALSLLLDLRIRHETANNKSLDDVMRMCYYEFFEKKHRGFTDQEFRQVCEYMAGTSLADFFAYISNTAELDYKKYFDYAGLTIEMSVDKDKKVTCHIKQLPNPTPLQSEIFQDWLKE